MLLVVLLGWFEEASALNDETALADNFPIYAEGCQQIASNDPCSIFSPIIRISDMDRAIDRWRHWQLLELLIFDGWWSESAWEETPREASVNYSISSASFRIQDLVAECGTMCLICDEEIAASARVAWRYHTPNHGIIQDMYQLWLKQREMESFCEFLQGLEAHTGSSIRYMGQVCDSATLLKVELAHLRVVVMYPYVCPYSCSD